MDAAQTNTQKIGFILATALLFAAPVYGTTVLTADSTTVSVDSSCKPSQIVTLKSSDGTSIPFTVKIQYGGATPDTGDQNGAWLYTTIPNFGTTSNGTSFSASTGTGTAGVPLTVGLQRSLAALNDQAKVILTPNDVNIQPVSITVNYQNNSSCGGNTGTASNGSISITPGSLSLTAALGAQASQTLLIQNLTGQGATFTVSLSGGNWLSYSANSTSLSANGQTPVTVTADGSKVSSAGTYTGTVTITPQTGFGAAINISVSFVVTTGTGTGGGSGTLTLNGPSATTYPISFTYIAPNPPSGVCIPIQDTAAGANSYNYQVTTNSGGNWLLANNNISGVQSGTLAPASQQCVLLTFSNTLATLTSGAYQGTVTLTSSSSSTATITVTLYVSTGAAPGVTVVPGLVYTFPGVAPNSSALQQQQFTINAASGVNLGVASAPSPPSWFTMSVPTAVGTAESFTVTVNPVALGTGLYFATVTIPSSGTSSGTTTILIVLPVGQGGATGGGLTATAAPTTLAFQHQVNSTFFSTGQEGQTVTIAGQQGGQWSASIIYGAGASNWLQFDAPFGGTGTFGTGPASLVVDLSNGVQNLASSLTPYTATVAITTPSGNANVAVTLLVTPSNIPVMFGKPALLTFFSNSGLTPANQTVQVVGSDNPTSSSSPLILAGTPTASWLTATASGNTMTVSVNVNGQTTGLYAATIPISASAYSNPINYPVVLVVNGGGGTVSGPLTLSTTAMSFSGVTSQSAQPLNITASGSVNFTATAAEQSCTNSTWLQISPSGSLSASSQNTPISVTVFPSGIANGSTCTGTISLGTTGTTQTVSVTMTVGTASGGGNVVVTPLQMSFAYTQQQTIPAAQTATILNAITSTPGIPFTVATAVQGGVANWLAVSANSGTTPFNNPGLSISVAPGSLGAGTFQGTVTITPNGGTTQVINVTIVVTGSAVVSATPTTISLSYQVGSTSPTSVIHVSGGGASGTFTAVAASSGWLKVAPGSGTTPNTGTLDLTVSLDPTVLATLVPVPGGYSGTITVTGTSPATGTTIVNVSLNITAPLPTISGITNAASGVVGPLSPGEIISIFAPPTGPIGPLGSFTTQLDSTGKVATTLGGVQVKFLPTGDLAPLLAVTAGQINAVVPYNVAGIVNLSVQVLYLGQTSNAWPVTGAATAPGIFTANQTGSGPAAMGQYDATGAYKGVNQASNPAQKGWYLAIYMTGEGKVTPAALTGAVTQVAATPPFTPVPVSGAPTVLIDGQPATVSGYGEAAGFVSGVLQVNVLVPQTPHSGPVTLSVSLGNGSSQANVTAFVQ